MENAAGSRRSRYGRAIVVGAWLSAAQAQATVTVAGVEDDVRENVLAVLRLDDEPCDAARRRIEQSFAAAPAEVRTALEGYGYYGAQITSALRFDTDCWVAELEIVPNDRVVLRRVDLTVTGDAARDPAFASLTSTSPLAPGRPLIHREYETLKSSLSVLAVERGYVDARFVESRVDIYPPELAADVTLEFAAGRRYRFGEIVLDQSVLEDEFVLAFVGFEPGDVYDGRLLAQTRLDLINSGYFDSVDIRPLPANRDGGRIPIAMALTPAPKRLIGYGVGFSTDTGVRLRFTRNIRRFNELGHQLNFNAQVSPVLSEAVATYRIPYGDPRNQWVSFDAGLNREDTDTSESESLQLGVRRVLQKATGWGRTEYLSLLVEDFEVGEQFGRSRLLMPGTEWSRLRADNPLRPSRGSRLVFELRGAGDRLGSDTSFVQVIGRGKWVWGVPGAGRVLVRTHGGHTWVDEILELPPSVRFFAGGDNSVRGYDYETLGPTNDAGEVVGGSRLLTASVELEYPVKGPWSVAAFVDAGNAFDDSSPALRRGVGLGARWQSPLGPIRIDIAKPQDGPDDDVRLHISVGPDL